MVPMTVVSALLLTDWGPSHTLMVSLRLTLYLVYFMFQKRFREVQIEELYVRYWLRLQRVLLFKLLVVIAIYGVIVLILYNVPRRKTVIEQFTETDQFTKQVRRKTL